MDDKSSNKCIFNHYGLFSRCKQRIALWNCSQVIYSWKYDGIVNGLTVDKIIAINNLKYAWQFILENDEIGYDFKTIGHLHKLICDKLVLDQNLGRLRSTPVNMGGTIWNSQLPIESQIKEELESII